MAALLSAFLLFSIVHAAEVDVTMANNAVTQDQTVQANVSLDTKGESANAVQAEVTFSPGMFKFEKIEDGGSAVSLWVSPPKESSPGVIDFAGIMPGGFTGTNGLLFSIELQPLGVGTGTIQVASATVLANDGLGSPLSVDVGSASINVIAANTSSISVPPSALQNEYAAPNPFVPQIVSDPNIFNGRYFLVFSTTDSQSGIDHYEVLEVPSGASGKPFSSWQSAVSPYVLTDQSLSSDVYVRAVDHDGNFVVVKIPARHPSVRWNYWGLSLAVVVILAFVLLLSIWKRRRRSHL